LIFFQSFLGDSKYDLSESRKFEDIPLVYESLSLQEIDQSFATTDKNMDSNFDFFWLNNPNKIKNKLELETNIDFQNISSCFYWLFLYIRHYRINAEYRYLKLQNFGDIKMFKIPLQDLGNKLKTLNLVEIKPSDDISQILNIITNQTTEIFYEIDFDLVKRQVFFLSQMNFANVKNIQYKKIQEFYQKINNLFDFLQIEQYRQFIYRIYERLKYKFITIEIEKEQKIPIQKIFLDIRYNNIVVYQILLSCANNQEKELNRIIVFFEQFFISFDQVKNLETLIKIF
jgi:hypothetical protein